MSTPELKPEQWTYSQYRATLRKDGNFFAIVTPNGRDALSETAANELLALLNRHNPAESALNAAREAIEIGKGYLERIILDMGLSGERMHGTKMQTDFNRIEAALAQIDKALSPQQSKTT